MTKYNFYLTVICCLFLMSCEDDNTDTTNQINLEWKNIPAGEFTTGQYDTSNSLDYSYDIMVNEMSNAEYVHFLNEAYSKGSISTDLNSSVFGYYHGDEKWGEDNYEFLDLDDADCRIEWDGNEFMVVNGYDNYPVVEVTWMGAWAMAAFYGYSLPTQTEWEKAARGNTGWDYPWGDEDPTCDMATYAGGNGGGGATDITQTSGMSPYGLLNMAGNVWEWVASFSQEFDYKREYCGGGWTNYQESIKSWKVESGRPDESKYDTGFRLIRME